MRLRQVRLQDFRCFEDLTLELHPEFNLLVGANGAGKTAVLEGVSVALGSWLKALHVDQRPILNQDVRRSGVVHGGIVSRETAVSTTVEVKGNIQGQDVYWFMQRTGMAHREVLGMLSGIADHVRDRLPTNEIIELPVVAYYGTNRLSHSATTTAQSANTGALGSILDGYTSCLGSTSDPQMLATWMAWREMVRIQDLSNNFETGTPIETVREPLLEAISGAVQNCIEGVKRFYYSLRYQDLRLDFIDGRTIPFSLLSDGYRNLLTVVADIAVRAARLNPHHGAQVAAKVRGVVLIDELDLHLHPAWQRRVIGDLRRTFPNIQFVATTHSPQVVSTAKPEWIRVLTADQQVGTALHTYGRDSNSLLNEVFGTSERPIETERKIEEVEALLSQRKLDDARATLRILERDLGPDDAIVHGLLWELNDIQVNDAKDPQES